MVAQLITEMKIKNDQFNMAIAESERKVTGFSSVANKGLIGIGLAFGVAATAGGLFLRAVSQNAKAIGELYDNTQKLGIGVSKFQELEQAASKAGLSSEGLRNTLSKMQNAIGAASFGDTSKLDAFKAIGLNVKELLALSPDQQFLKIASALKEVGQGAQQANLATTLLGKGGKEALGLINSNIEETIAQYRKLGITLTDEQAKAADSFDESKALLGKVWSGFGDQVTAELSPAFEKMTQWLLDSVEQYGGLNKVAKNFTAGLITGLTTIGEKANQVYGVWKQIQALDSQTSAGYKGLTDGVSDPNGNNILQNPLKTIYQGITGTPSALQDYLHSIRPDKARSELTGGSYLPDWNAGATKESRPTLMAGTMLDASGVSSPADKASKSLLDLAAAAKKTKDDAFSSAISSGDGTSEQIDRIMNGISKKDVAKSEFFDDTARRIIENVQSGVNPNDDLIKGQFQALQGVVKERPYDNTTAMVKAIEELKKFVYKDTPEQKLTIEVKPTPYAHIEWSKSKEGKTIFGENMEEFTNKQAQGVAR